MIVCPSDHLILDPAEFRRSVEEAFEFVEAHNILMTIGIKPSRPDTGFGYIQIAGHERANDTHGDIYKVKTFTEKPNLEMAKVFVNSGEFFWNAGIFVWKARDIIAALEQHLLDTWQLFKSIEKSFGTPAEQEQINRVYSECRAISVDFGVMEKAENVYVRISDFGWSDIGTWGSLYQYSEKDETGNVAAGEVMFYETHNCIVKMPAGHLAVIEGLKDYIVVESNDVLMICKKEHEQTIKTFIDDVQYNKGDKFI